MKTFIIYNICDLDNLDFEYLLTKQLSLSFSLIIGILQNKLFDRIAGFFRGGPEIVL